MKIKIVILALAFSGILFTSCKDQNSKDASTETEKLELEEVTTPEFKNENDELVDKVKTYIATQYLTDADLRAISEDQRKFQIQEIDLNNDGKKEVFVNLNSVYFCGSGGCTLLLLTDQIEPITKFTVTRTPLYVEKAMENGWNTIMTQSEGKWRRLIYKSGSYPSNPSIVEVIKDAPAEGAEIIFKDNSDLETYDF